MQYLSDSIASSSHKDIDIVCGSESMQMNVTNLKVNITCIIFVVFDNDNLIKTEKELKVAR